MDNTNPFRVGAQETGEPAPFMAGYARYASISTTSSRSPFGELTRKPNLADFVDLDGLVFDEKPGDHANVEEPIVPQRAPEYIAPPVVVPVVHAIVDLATHASCPQCGNQVVLYVCVNCKKPVWPHQGPAAA